MVSEKRPAADLLAQVEQLAATVPGLGFFPLVSLLERLTAGAPRVGETGPASEELLHFRHDPSFAFSTSDVSSVTARRKPRPVLEVVTTFLGLTGSVTPLPPHLAEEILWEEPGHSPRRDFLDLFHHRALSLLYRVQARYGLTHEHARDELDRWSRRVLALTGLDVYSRPPATSLPTWRLLRLAPLLARRSRTARMLEVALEDVLEEELQGARVSVRQFVESRARLPDPELTRLGQPTATLGRTALLGHQLIARAGKFTLCIAPLSRDVYPRFLPEGDLAPVVRAVVELVLRDPLDFELELGLAEATPFALSVRGTARLGRDTLVGVEREREARLRVSAALSQPL